jgi:hypothetical protein
MIHKNVILICVFIFSFLSCNSQGIKGNKIVIKYVDYTIETPFAITPDYFETAFKEELDSIITSNEEIEEKIVKFIENAKFIDTSTSIDARQKLLFNTKNEIIEFFSDGESKMLIGNKPIAYNFEFQKLINSMIDKKQSSHAK